MRVICSLDSKEREYKGLPILMRRLICLMFDGQADRLETCDCTVLELETVLESVYIVYIFVCCNGAV